MNRVLVSIGYLLAALLASFLIQKLLKGHVPNQVRVGAVWWIGQFCLYPFIYSNMSPEIDRRRHFLKWIFITIPLAAIVGILIH